MLGKTIMNQAMRVERFKLVREWCKCYIPQECTVPYTGAEKRAALESILHGFLAHIIIGMSRS